MSIAGYENNDVARETLTKKSHYSTIRSGITIPVTTTIQTPEQLTPGDYILSITFWNKEGLLQEREVPFVVIAPSHDITIKEILINPETVKSGEDINVRLNLQNTGDSDENARVEYTIKALGISQATYLDNLSVGERSTTQETIITVPSCTPAGSYTLTAIAVYRDGRASTSRSAQFTIKQGTCSDSGTLSAPTTTGTIKAGEEFSFPLKITNTDDEAQSYHVSTEGGDSIGKITITPSTIVIQPRSTETVRLEGTVDEDAKGERSFFIVLKTLTGEERSRTPVTITIEPSPLVTIRTILEIVLISAVIILLALLLTYGWRTILKKE